MNDNIYKSNKNNDTICPVAWGQNHGVASGLMERGKGSGIYSVVCCGQVAQYSTAVPDESGNLLSIYCLKMCTCQFVRFENTPAIFSPCSPLIYFLSTTLLVGMQLCLFQSTIIMPCNNSGYMDPKRTVGWAIIDFDWSNT